MAKNLKSHLSNLQFMWKMSNFSFNENSNLHRYILNCALDIFTSGVYICVWKIDAAWLEQQAVNESLLDLIIHFWGLFGVFNCLDKIIR